MSVGLPPSIQEKQFPISGGSQNQRLCSSHHSLAGPGGGSTKYTNQTKFSPPNQKITFKPNPNGPVQIKPNPKVLFQPNDHNLLKKNITTKPSCYMYLCILRVLRLLCKINQIKSNQKNFIGMIIVIH